jgi:acetyl-CoA acetyltransferase
VSPALLADCAVSTFGRHEGHGLVECGAAMVCELLARHPGLTEMDSLWVGSARPGESHGFESGLAAAIAQSAGLGGRPATDVHAFCASANVAFIHAAAEIAAGVAEISLVVGVEHMSAYRGTGPLVPPALPPWARILSPPVFYGLCASRYLSDYSVNVAALADISVRNRQAGASNPNARFRQAVSRDEVLDSKMISNPLTLLQCSAPADGAGAALLVSEAGAARLDLSLDRCVRLLGAGHTSAPAPDSANLVSFPEDVAAGRLAFAQARVSPGEVGVTEVHDAFTIAQAIHLEDLGLAARGTGAHLGAASADLVVNPSGGLLARGHPLGATGIAQLDSVRRYATEHGVIGLVHEAGGLQHLGQLISTVLIFGPAAG